jgi:hypothetical protein
MLWNFPRCLQFIHEVNSELCAQCNVSLEIGRLKILISFSRPETCAAGRQRVNFKLLCVTLLGHVCGPAGRVLRVVDVVTLQIGGGIAQYSD